MRPCALAFVGLLACQPLSPPSSAPNSAQPGRLAPTTPTAGPATPREATALSCVIGGVSFPAGPNPANPVCQTCEPIRNHWAWTSQNSGAHCGTGCAFCNTTGSCIPGTATFSQVASYNTGACPTWVVAGDFNGDGKQDLATVNSCDNDLDLFLGNGDGTFGLPTTYQPPNSPKLLWSMGVANSANQTTADFNHDGKLDLAVTDIGGNVVDVLLGDGAGGLTFSAQYPSNPSPDSLVAVDLNGDGWADLAYAEQYSAAVSVRLNTGGGSFGAASSYGVGQDPSVVATGIFTKGGPPDLATSNSGQRSLSVLLNQGGASSFASSSAATGNNPQGIAAADFNQDGAADLATADNCDNTVSVLLNNGSGGFPSRSTYSAGTGPISLISQDFNGDGYPDLAVASGGGWTFCPGPANSTLEVLLNQGNGTFGSPQIYSVGSLPFALASADFDGDGRPDLAIVNYQSTSDQLVILKNVCTPTATIAASVPNPLIWLKPGIGLTPSASAVSEWADQSGNGNNFTQGVPGRRPTVVANAVAGYSAVQFAASASETLTNGADLVPPYSIFYVGRELGPYGSGEQRILNGLANNWFLGYWGSSMDQAYFQGWITPQGTPPADFAWHLYDATSDGTMANIYRDGAALASSSSYPSGPNGLSLTCNNGVAGDECANAQVAELLVYGADLATAQRQAVEQYLIAKFGIGGPQPPVTWLKAGVGLTLNGSQVATWADQSGNGNDFTQSTASRQPSAVQYGLHGYTVVQFSAAATQTLTNAANLPPPYSLFYVARELGTANQRILNGLSNNWLLGWWNGAMDQALFQTGWPSPIGTPPTDTAWHLYEATSDGVTSHVYRRGTLLFTSSSYLAGPDGLSLTCYNGGGSECSDAQVAELMIYSSALTTSQRQTVEQYLTAKFAL